MSDPGDTCGCESCQRDPDIEQTHVIGFTITGSEHLDHATQERLAGG